MPNPDDDETVLMTKDGVTRRAALGGIVGAALAPHMFTAQLAADRATERHVYDGALKASFFGADDTATAADNTTAITLALALAREAVDLEGKTLDINSFSAVSGKKLVNGTLNWMGDGTQAVLIDSVSDFALENVTIKQDGSVSAAAEKRGIAITRSSTDISIVNCRFSGFNRQGIWASACERVNISGNVLTDCNLDGAATLVDATDDYGAIALFANCTTVTIAGNQVFEGGTGISVFGGSVAGTDICRNISITGNVCTGDPTNVSGMGIYCLKNLQNIAIVGNICQSYRNEGIVIVNTDVVTAYTVNDVTISGNTCRANIYAGISIEKGGGVAHTFRNISITSNTVYGPDSSDTGGHGILLDNDSHSTGTYQGIAVAGNTVSTPQASGSATNWFGIYADHATSANITDNTVIGTWTEGIRDEQCRYSAFNGNVCISGAGKKCLVIIQNTGGDTPNVYQGNNLHGTDATSYLIDRGGANPITSATITGNLFHRGILDLDSCTNCNITGNTVRELAGSSVITNTGVNALTALNSGWTVSETYGPRR